MGFEAIIVNCNKGTQACPCGYYNHPEKECVCAPGVVQKYLNKISGPLLDRIDLHVEVTPVPFSQLSEEAKSENSDAVRTRVIKARHIQEERYKENNEVHANAQMNTKQLHQVCKISQAGSALLKKAMDRLKYHKEGYVLLVVAVQPRYNTRRQSPKLFLNHLDK